MSEEKKTFKLQGAQGDVLLVRVDKMPAHGLTEQKVPTTGVVLAHSETGHHHVLQAKQGGAIQHFTVDGAGAADPLQGFINVTGLMASLRHMKGGPDAHGEINVPTGVYQVRRAREWNPWSGRESRVVD